MDDGMDRRLASLVSEVQGLGMPEGAGELRISEVCADSRAARPGSLFVALRGTRVDGHDHVAEAIRRGAVAVLVERRPEEPLTVPVLEARDTRAALARVAAAWYDFPARRLRMVGATGTVGKTTVVKMIEAILLAAGRSIGTIGTLGVSGGSDDEEQTGFTAPDPLLLHRSLAGLVDAGREIAAMEVTSHALHQRRVDGIEYQLGLFTNLVPLEHADYHGSFRAYVEVKRRFLDHLAPGAPLIYSQDDALVRRVAQRPGLVPLGCGRDESARIRIEDVEVGVEGTSLTLHFRAPTPLLDGGEVAPLRLPLRLRLLGRGSVTNAALAATAALSLGASPEAIQHALADLEPLPRRMSILHSDPFIVLDDAANHPDSVSALFEVVEQLPIARAHALLAIRGQRGPRINRRTAEALAIWAARRPLDTLILTRSEDAVDALNRVREPEAEAFRSVLRKKGIEYEEISTLAESVPTVLSRAKEGDLVLLLGTQGMDAGSEIAKGWLRERTARRNGA